MSCKRPKSLAQVSYGRTQIRLVAMKLESGTIFLSHTASDKHFVEQGYEKLDASNTFYDIRTIEPGQSFIEAMKAGTTGKNLFVLFHSHNTKHTWVDYETRLADI